MIRTKIMAAMRAAKQPQSLNQICTAVKASSQIERTAVATELSLMAHQGVIERRWHEASADFNGGKTTVHSLPKSRQEPARKTTIVRTDGFQELPQHLIPRIPRSQRTAPGIRIVERKPGDQTPTTTPEKS